MKNKTWIEVTEQLEQCKILKGQKGYIDGYCMGANGIPCAIIVCGSIIDFIPPNYLKVILIPSIF